MVIKNIQIYVENSENIIYIFCQLNESLNHSDNNINIEGTKFNYNKLEISIIKKDEIYIIQLEKSIPFLYSKSQTINLEEGKNTYYLKFNAENYNNEKIIYRLQLPRFTIILDKCSIEKKELTCQIDKSELEEYYCENPNHIFNLYYPYPNTTGEPLIPIPTIEGIFINKNLSKIDLKITISKLLEKYADSKSFFAYEVETNVTKISNLVSGGLKLNFSYNGEIQERGCYFKKTNENPLYLLCSFSNEGNISLSEIKEEIILNNIHDKYNFYIQPVKINDTININKNDGDEPNMIIPKTLDFTTNDNIPIYIFFFSYSNNQKVIKLNPDAKENLECKKLDSKNQFKNYEESILRCIVPKSHFENKQNGYYNTYHLNNMNISTKFYELSTIHVILSNDGGSGDGSSKPKNLVGIIVGSVVGGLALIAIIVIIIICVKKKKADSNEISTGKSGKNILPNSAQVELVEGDNFGNE